MKGIDNMLNYLSRLKKKYMYTGWLQYVPVLVIAFMTSLVAIISRWLGFDIFSWILRTIALLLFLRFIYDLITVKYQLHPRERKTNVIKNRDVFQIMRERQSCRSFQKGYLDQDDLAFLKQVIHDENVDQYDSFRFGDGIQFYCVKGNINVWPVVNATEFIVALVPATYNRLAIIEAGRRLERIVIKATRRGIGTCWIGPGADHESIKSMLGDRFDAHSHHILCVCAIGYPSKYIPLLIRGMNLKTRKRHPIDQVFFLENKMENSVKDNRSIFSRYENVFEAGRWSPSSFNGQPTRCIVEEDPSSVTLKLLTVKKSRYYSPVAAGIFLANCQMGFEALDRKGTVFIEDKVAGYGEVGAYTNYEVTYRISLN